VAPNYFVEFRDYRGRKPQERWGDRLFPDGSWEANLLQFYQRSWPKIIADLKVPFTLRGVQRTDETSAHEALREAFVNAIIHADYKVGGGIVIMRLQRPLSDRQPRYPPHLPGAVKTGRRFRVP
jgi:ATP-dependent DNA helicase RecG